MNKKIATEVAIFFKKTTPYCRVFFNSGIAGRERISIPSSRKDCASSFVV
jgi:hypothetical protein